jgi:hypothetical protein
MEELVGGHEVSLHCIIIPLLAVWETEHT